MRLVRGARKEDEQTDAQYLALVDLVESVLSHPNVTLGTGRKVAAAMAKEPVRTLTGDGVSFKHILAVDQVARLLKWRHLSAHPLMRGLSLANVPALPRQLIFENTTDGKDSLLEVAGKFYAFCGGCGECKTFDTPPEGRIGAKDGGQLHNLPYARCMLVEGSPNRKALNLRQGACIAPTHGASPHNTWNHLLSHKSTMGIYRSLATGSYHCDGPNWPQRCIMCGMLVSSGRKACDHAKACNAIKESNGKLATRNISFTFEGGP